MEVDDSSALIVGNPQTILSQLIRLHSIKY